MKQHPSTLTAEWVKESSNISTSSFQAEIPFTWFSSDDKMKGRNKPTNEYMNVCMNEKRNKKKQKQKLPRKMEENDRHFEGNF